MLSAVSVLVVAQSSSEIPEGLMNNPVHFTSQRIKERFGETKRQNILHEVGDVISPLLLLNIYLSVKTYEASECRRGEAVSQELDFCAAVWDAEQAASSEIRGDVQAIGIDARICVPLVKGKAIPGLDRP